MYGYWGYTFGPLGMVVWALFWILIIGLFVRLIHGPGWHRGLRNRGQQGPWQGKDALDLLKERYAKGEINKQEFEEKKADLLK